MKFCPKCRSFYDDESLAFCRTDGVPLVKLNQSNELWAEGRSAVETSRQIIQKQTRRQKLKRISRVLITTVMMIMVISVVAMNIYIYTPPKEKEKVENITPSATIEPSVSPKPAETPIVINSPSPTVSPSPRPTISPSPTKSATPEITPTPTKTPIICSTKQEEAVIRNFNVSIWRNKILPEKSAVLAKNLKTPAVRADAELGLTEVSAQVSPDCKQAAVFVKYKWTISQINHPPIPIEGNRTFSCRKEGIWKC